MRDAIREQCPIIVEGMKYGHAHFDLNGFLFALGSQKHYLAFYVAEEEAVAAYVAATSRKDVGKGCIRFTTSHPIEQGWVAKIIQSAVELRLRGSGSTC